MFIARCSLASSDLINYLHQGLELTLKKNLPELSRIVRQDLAEDVAASVARLKTHAVKTLKEEVLREQFATSVTKRAGDVFNWSAADSNKNLINIQLMGQLNIGANVVPPVVQDDPGQAQPVDIEASVVDGAKDYQA